MNNDCRQRIELYYEIKAEIDNAIDEFLERLTIAKYEAPLYSANTTLRIDKNYHYLKIDPDYMDIGIFYRDDNDEIARSISIEWLFLEQDALNKIVEDSNIAARQRIFDKKKKESEERTNKELELYLNLKKKYGDK